MIEMRVRGRPALARDHAPRPPVGQMLRRPQTSASGSGRGRATLLAMPRVERPSLVVAARDRLRIGGR